MNKQTVIPGARLRRDPITNAVQVDHKGRPIWDIPEHCVVGEHMTVQTSRGARYVKTMKKFPVYRGCDASYMRYGRAQIKRWKREEDNGATATAGD